MNLTTHEHQEDLNGKSGHLPCSLQLVRYQARSHVPLSLVFRPKLRMLQHIVSALNKRLSIAAIIDPTRVYP